MNAQKKQRFVTAILRHRQIIVLFLASLLAGCHNPSSSNDDNLEFPDALVAFDSYEQNPVFSGTGTDTWDKIIRERGFILKEADGYHLWYTGYDTLPNVKMLGYATSPDGFEWTRYPGNPIFTDSWVEDMMVIKSNDLYYMFAEGAGDIAHMLTSTDKIHWKDHGSLVIKQSNGAPLTPGPYGTPTVFIKDGLWYLFYERNDLGIWVATSRDLKEWINVHDEPVITSGPEAHDKFGVALNQVIEYDGLYYAYYHGTAFEDWSEWSTSIAVSKDLVSWKKYPSNPILMDNKSSAIVVPDGSGYRLYTMHDQVHVHFPSGGSNATE